MILTGKKVRLRLVAMQDVARLHKWINDKKINKYITAEIPISLAKERKYVRSMVRSKNSKHFIIEILPSREPIGIMSLGKIDQRHHKATTGAFIAESKYWGEGYGSDAKMALLKYAFTKLNMNRVESHVFTSNPRSRRYNEKCGYKYEGLLRQNVCKNGKYIDDWILAVLKKDWLKLAKRQGYI